MVDKNKLWVEKYRPSSVDDFVFTDEQQQAQITNWIKNQDCGNILFYGTAGTGKTSLALLLVKCLNIDPYDFLKINASKERNIDVMREKVTNFASTIPFGKLKVVLLDEADGLTPDAQNSLKGMIEQYTSCRWILTANAKNRIIPPIHSRTQSMEISRLDHTEYLARVAKILIDENIDFELETLELYTSAYWPDLRKCINSLQTNCIDGKLLSPTKSSVATSDYRLEAIDLFKQGKFREARSKIASQIRPEDAEEFFRFLYDNLDLLGDTDEQKDGAILIIRKGLVQIPLASDVEILISAVLTELMQNRG
jgi:replication factor C small subunit